MDKEKFLKEIKIGTLIFEVRADLKTDTLKYISQSKKVPNTLLFTNKEGKIVNRILDEKKLNDEIGPTKFFLNPKDAISYYSKLSLLKH